jgi:enoyl-CoA hydratase/carnithine racemase
VASRGATFRFAGAIYGVPVGVARTVGQVGLSTAKDWVLSSRDIAADEAYRVGFVQRLVDDGAARTEAMRWLTTVADRDADIVAVLKQAFNERAGVRDRLAFENDTLRVQAETGELPGERPTSGPSSGTVRPRRG